MSGYSHSPIYNKVNDILQQQQQSYSDITREVNLLQQQQQQSYSELARQVAILPQPCYSDSGLSLPVSDHQFRNCFPHSDSTRSQSAKVCSCSQNLFASPLTFPQLKHIYICIPSLVFMSPSYLSCARALGAQHVNREDY